MLQKKRLISVEKKHLLGLIAVVGVISALWCQSFISLADSTGTVTADSAKIRAKADTSSEVVGSAAHGMKVSIRNEVQDSSGMLWYEVYVDSNTTGYIRSDLVDKADGGSGSQSDGNTASQGGQLESTASGASVDPETVLDAQYAVVTAEAIKVRTAPSTNEAVVDRLTRDAQVIISGETVGSDGKTWFYVTFTGTGDVERSGYIRSDLLSRGDMVPVPEEVTPEPQETVPEPEEPVNMDYELTYEQTAEGTLEYFIWDYTDKENGKKYRLLDLMAATKQRSEMDAADAKTLVRQRIVIVILIVLLVALIVVAVIMALKLREVYYEDYEDEEEQEEQPTQRRRRTQEDEDDSAKRRRRTEDGTEVSARSRRRMEENEDRSARRRRSTEESEGSSARRRRSTEESEDSSTRRRRRMEESGEETERSARRRSSRDERESSEQEVEYREDDAGSATVKTAPKRKAKNFLLDDDEFEFEFLNMDDKGL